MSETYLEIETYFQYKFRRMECKRIGNSKGIGSLRSETLSTPPDSTKVLETTHTRAHTNAHIK